MNIHDLAARRAWGITPEMLETILDVAGRENLTIEAVEARLGRRLENTRTVTTRNGVAIVPVTGPVFRHASMLHAVSGATSVQVLATDFQAALDDKAINAIIPVIDSPGGTVAGIDELAGMVFAGRAVKPIHAYVDGVCCSAAYWLAAACHSITVAPTAMLGSIGIVMAHRDTREADARAGVRVVEIVSSRAPNKRPDMVTDDGRAQVQAIVDAQERVFIESIARFRGITAEKIVADFGQGGIRVGAEAVAAGMADAVGSFETLLAELAGSPSAKSRTPPAKGTRAMPDDKNDTGQTVALSSITPGYIAASHASIAEKFRAEGRATGIEAGVAAERARILAIQAHGRAADMLAPAARDKLVADLIADGAVSADQAAGRVLAAQSAARQGRLDALVEDGAKGPGASPHAGDAGTGKTVEERAKEEAALPLDQRCKAEYERDPKLRAEFRELGDYVAYRKAEARGAVRTTRAA